MSVASRRRAFGREFREERVDASAVARCGIMAGGRRKRAGGSAGGALRPCAGPAEEPEGFTLPPRRAGQRCVSAALAEKYGVTVQPAKANTKGGARPGGADGGFMAPTKRLVYAAVPGSIITFEVIADRNRSLTYRFNKRIVFEDTPAAPEDNAAIRPRRRRAVQARLAAEKSATAGQTHRYAPGISRSGKAQSCA